MRLHVLSDLHLEQAEFTPPQTDADVVILAGDTAPGTAGVAWASATFGPRPVLYLAGNHEFYGFALPALIDELRSAAKGTNVHVLERDALILGGVRFLGCTLWTAFDAAGEERREGSMRFAERVVNDYKFIGSSRSGAALRAQETLELHRESRAWLTEQIAVPHDGPTVVITHHVPHVTRRSDSLVVQALAGSIVSDLRDLIGADHEVLWIHGHNHRVTDRIIDGTRLVSNPRGYPREQLSDFDPGLVIELP